MSNPGEELALYEVGNDQWELLTEDEAISRGLLNSDRGLSGQAIKIGLAVTTAAAVVGGGYLLYRYYNSRTGKEEKEILTPEEAARKGLTNGQKILIGASAAAAIGAGGYFMYRYFNPATGHQEQKMLTEAEARGMGLSEAQRVSTSGGNPPIVQGSFVQPNQYPPSQANYAHYQNYNPQYVQQPYGQAPPYSQAPQYSQQPYYGQPPQQQHGQQPYYGQPPPQQYPPQQGYAQAPNQQYNYSGKDAALRKEFEMLDVNRSGYIDQEDLYRLTGGSVSKSILKYAVKYVDKDKDGKIGFEEFKAIRNKLPL